MPSVCIHNERATRCPICKNERRMEAYRAIDRLERKITESCTMNADLVGMQNGLRRIRELVRML